ncbi:hypothetical protein JXO59_11870, partial [candidate division KSB1 bacterium]|nr:hypothetical protein [candidate division KSB1 bacterium]
MRNLEICNRGNSNAITVAIVAALFCIGSAGLSLAAEIYVPNDTSHAQLQTNGPVGELDNGDWWSNNNTALGNQPHVYLIYVPITVPEDFLIHLDIYDPECFATGSELDEQKGGQWDETTFKLIAPDGNTIVVEQTYVPADNTSERWLDFAEFTTAQYGTGIFQLQVTTAVDDENSYRIRLDETDPDDIPDSGDELNLAVLRSSIQFSQNSCVDLYYYVPQMAELCIANFDMDSEGSVLHRQPSGAMIAGTISGDAVWNNSESPALPPPGGDQIASPQNGWWMTRICAT